MGMQNNQISDIFQPYFAHFPPIQNPFLYVEKFLTFSSTFWTNSISLIFQWKNPALAISDAFSMPTCTRQTCVKAGIWSIPSLHAKKGRHELKWVSDLFHSDIQNKADMCEKECLSSSMPFAEKARHVLDLCVSDLFHPFTQNKADMCEKRCLTNSMSLAEKARHGCHGCLV